MVFLRGLAGVKQVEQVVAEHLPANHFKLRVIAETSVEPVGRDIAATVVGSGLGLYEMRRVQATLEDVFLQLTTEETPADADMTASNTELTGEAA
jgi:ABC-2 type transport system ATP-binding protein